MFGLSQVSKNKMSKVIPRFFGGLGNQLFIYAAARRLAMVNGVELVLDDVSGFLFDHEYQRHYQLDHFNIPCRKATRVERMEPLSRARRYIKRRWNQKLSFENRHYLVQESIDFDSRLLTFHPRGTVYLEGHWQSEGYFKDIESQVRQDLRFTPPTDSANQKMVAHILTKPAVAIHLRYFDAPGLASTSGSQNNTPGDYYNRAISEMEQLVDHAHYFIFSDQPDEARARISLPDSRVTLIRHNLGDSMAYADLWLMSQCRHFIIANSTFSWWGAWLGEHPDKIVIAPSFEQRTGNGWGFVGLLPDHWLSIEV